jgi:hypothetical protein
VIVQDLVAIAVAVAAGLWLVRTLWRQLVAPSCGKAETPPGTDGFVPLDALASPRKNSGRPEGRPEHKSADDSRRASGPNHQYMS